MIFPVFALRSLKVLRLIVVGSLLNFRYEILGWRIAVLQPSLNKEVLCLFEVEVFAIVSFATEMRLSVKCFVWSMMLYSLNSFY